MNHIPAKYIDNYIRFDKVYDKVFLITKNSEFIEVSNKQIINYISLKSYIKSSLSNCIIEFQVFERNDYVLIIMIRLDKVLIVVKRSRENKCEIVRVYHDLKEYRIEGQIYKSHIDSVAKISYGDERKEVITSFYENSEDICRFKENNYNFFKSIDDKLRIQKQCLMKSLEVVRKEQQLKFAKIIGDQKFLPRFLRLNDVDDTSPLIRFGSFFTRFCNEKIVIGIPLFNCSSLERRLTIEDLKLIVSPTLSNGNFNYDLLKLKTECPSFEEFEELFSDESELIPEVPANRHEWNRSKVLYANEAGAFVVVTDINEFIHELNHSMTFNISYKINDENTTANIITSLGNYSIDSKTIFSKSLCVTSWTFEKYRNLLALTCTSNFIVEVNISFEKYHDNRIENFLVKKLNFEILKMKKDEEHKLKSYNENSQTGEICLSLRHDYFLYCSVGYFCGTLIRLNLLNDLLMKGKIYVRTFHQLIMLMQGIYFEYSNQCTIDLIKCYGFTGDI